MSGRTCTIGDNMQGVCFKSAVELADAVRTRRLGCRELLELFLGRVDRYNPALNAIVVQDRDAARQRADEADAALGRGAPWGALHGVPMTVKESFDRKGQHTTWGHAHAREKVAAEDAVAVQRLERAGAVVFGKTNVPEGLMDFQTYNALYGVTHNPWDPRCGPGGSSGGAAAALAAGLTGLELGSDIAGSVRNPAHFCGVFGHKPTWNLLPLRGHGIGTLRATDMMVAGPMARSAGDLALAIRILAAPDELEASGLAFALPALTKPLSSLRVAVWQNDPFAPVSTEVESAVVRIADALREAGAIIDTQARPDLTAAQSDEVFRALLTVTYGPSTPDMAFGMLVQRSAALAADDAGALATWLRATTMFHREFLRLDEQRTRLRWAWHRFFQSYDFMIMPAMPTAAFPHDHRPYMQRSLLVDGQEQNYFAGLTWAGLPSVAYLPATVIPAGKSRDGLPIGVQLVGPAYSDLQTIELAEQLEARGFGFVPPPGYEQ